MPALNLLENTYVETIMCGSFIWDEVIGWCWILKKEVLWVQTFIGKRELDSAGSVF